MKNFAIELTLPIIWYILPNQYAVCCYYRQHSEPKGRYSNGLQASATGLLLPASMSDSHLEIHCVMLVSMGGSSLISTLFAFTHKHSGTMGGIECATSSSIDVLLL